MSKFKRFLCAALAALILFYAPGFAPKAEAVADPVSTGILVGSVALSVSAVSSALLGGLGVNGDASSSAWQNLVSFVVEQLSSAGLVVDGMINVAKLRYTLDKQEALAGLATDSIQLVARALCDSKLLDPYYNGSLLNTETYSFYGSSYTITSSYPVYVIPVQYFNSYHKEWRIFPLFYSSSSFTCVAPNGYGFKIHNTSTSAKYAYGNQYSSNSPFSAYTLPSAWDESHLNELVVSLLSSDVSEISVTDVPVNMTDIPAAYPEWYNTGVADSDTVYLPLDIPIAIEPLPTTPEVTEPEATTPDDVPVAVTPEFLGGHFDGIKDLLNALLSHWLSFFVTCKTFFDSIAQNLSGWFDSVVARIDWAIHYLTAWLSDFWAAVVQAVTVSIPDFLNSIYEALETFFGVTVPAWITDVKAWALSLPRTITDAIAVALAAAFIPAAGYWDAKLAACMAAFPFFDSIITTGRSLGSFFSGLGSKPPIIYIDLQNSNSFVLGGRQIFMDLSWYSQYKPTVDTVLSAFLWLIVLWRLFLALPGILRGAVGLAGNMERVSEHFHHEED